MSQFLLLRYQKVYQKQRREMFQFKFHNCEEVWCAIMPNVDDRTVVLENFRVVSVDDGSLGVSDTSVVTTHLRLEKGTPVTIVSKQSHGTVLMLGAHTTVVKMDGGEGRCEVVANADLSYRMGTTIDKTLPPYRVVDGYLVPDPMCEKEDTDVVEVEEEEEVVQDGVTMDSISTPLTDASYDAWKGKYLRDVVSYAPDELLRAPNVKTHFSNVIVDNDLIYVNERGYLRMSKVRDTTNVFSNVGSAPDIRQIKAGIVIPLLANDGTRTTLTTDIGTHFLIHSLMHSTSTVLMVQDMDDWSHETLADACKKYQIRAQTTLHDVCIPIADPSYATLMDKHLKQLAWYDDSSEFLLHPAYESKFYNTVDIMVHNGFVFYGCVDNDAIARVNDTTNVFSNLTDVPEILQLSPGISIPYRDSLDNICTLTTGHGTHFVVNAYSPTVLELCEMNAWARGYMRDKISECLDETSCTDIDECASDRACDAEETEHCNAEIDVRNVSLQTPTFDGMSPTAKQEVVDWIQTTFCETTEAQCATYNSQKELVVSVFEDLLAVSVIPDDILRKLGVSDIFRLRTDKLEMHRNSTFMDHLTSCFAVALPECQFMDLKTKIKQRLSRTETRDGSGTVTGYTESEPGQIRRGIVIRKCRYRLNRPAPDRLATAREVCRVEEMEDDVEDVIDRPLPRLYNVFDTVRVKPPVQGARPFQACTHPGCSKGLHHSGICDAMTWETRKRTATVSYAPVCVNDDDVDQDDDSDDDLPLSQWRTSCPVAKRARTSKKMTTILETHFPGALRDALQGKLDALARGIVDANSQHSYRGVTIQPNGGYCAQTQIHPQGNNRYLGVFKRSVVGAYAVIVARLLPDHFDSVTPTTTMRHWMQMMINDDDVAQQWTERIRKQLSEGRSATRSRIEELD